MAGSQGAWVGPRTVPSLWVGEREVERVDGKGEAWRRACLTGKPANKNPLIFRCSRCPALHPNREVPQIRGEWVPHRLDIKVGNRLLPHGIYPKSQGRYHLQPPFDKEAQAPFCLHGRGSRQQGPREVTRPYGYQIHSACCRLHCRMQVATQSALFLRAVRTHVSANFRRDINNLRNSQRQGAACQMKDTWQKQPRRARELPLNICWASGS